MAGSIKEIGHRAERLIEQGNEADSRLKSCQSMVVQSSGRVAAARSQLARASETDEEGNPVGNVEAARRELGMAQQQLAVSRKALADAESNARQIEQAKKSEAAEIQRHNAVERMNLQKLRALRNKAFGENAEMMAEGMAERLNEAEEARIELLRSMGIDAAPEYVQEGAAGGGSAGWSGGGFGSLGINGQPQTPSGGGGAAGGATGGTAVNGASASPKSEGAEPCLEPNLSSPRNLSKSQYGFTKDENGNDVYDSPMEMDKYLYSKQGSAYDNYKGTCGLCSCANVARLAGVNLSEKDMIDYASKTEWNGLYLNKLCVTDQDDAGYNGGTTPETRKEILDHFGLESTLVSPQLDEDGNITSDTINDLANFVSEGKGVIISVDAGAFYNDLRMNGCGHAVTLTSVTKNSSGDITGFHVLDSNRGTVFYSAQQLQSAINPSCFNVTDQIIR